MSHQLGLGQFGSVHRRQHHVSFATATLPTECVSQGQATRRPLSSAARANRSASRTSPSRRACPAAVAASVTAAGSSTGGDVNVRETP